MKRNLLLVALLCSFFFAFAQKKKKTARGNHVRTEATTSVDYKQTGAPMPAIRLIVPTLTNEVAGKKKEAVPETKVITEQDLANNSNLLVMMFNPTCGHCEEQTDLFTQNISLFRNSKLVLMAGAPMLPYMEHFNSGRHVDKFPKTIIMGVDSAQFIDKTFRYESLPQINIYDHERKLLRSFTGLVSIDSLITYIE